MMRGCKTKKIQNRYELFDETPYRRYDGGIVRKSHFGRASRWLDGMPITDRGNTDAYT
jgi:hypothetical protein